MGNTGYCHCADCRKVSGSAFLVIARLDAKDLSIVSNLKPKRYSKIADSGREIIREFCPNCGSHLFGYSPELPEYVWIKAGSFDDPNVVEPTSQGWTDSKVSWADIPSDIVSFVKGKESAN